MYFALRNLKEHADDTLIEMKWLKDVFIELMEMMLDKNMDKEETFLILNLKQLTLDIHFLLEMAKWGGYLSDTIMNSYFDSESRIKSAFLSAGIDLER